MSNNLQMKNNNLPDKVEISEFNNHKRIIVAPREKTGYDIGLRILGFLSIIFITVGFIADKTDILLISLFLINFSLLVIIPLFISFISTKDRFEIEYNNENIIIRKSGIFTSEKKIEMIDVLSFELKRVTPNSEPFNAYLGFRSMFHGFNDFIPSFEIKGGYPTSILQYHDREIRA